MMMMMLTDLQWYVLPAVATVFGIVGSFFVVAGIALWKTRGVKEMGQ